MADIPRFAISIRQPWAWCIIHAGKDIENRSWYSKFRGPFAVHASQGMTKSEYEDCLAWTRHVNVHRPLPEGLVMPAFKDLPRGGIVGVATVTDCVSDSDSPWFMGRFGFVLSKAQPVDFIPVKGELGFFDWRRKLAEAA